MHKIAAFSQEESALIDKADKILKQTGKDIYSTFINQKQSLKIFALLVSKTPSLKSKERYGMDRNLDAFSPPLMSLWRERCRAVPVLGTLQGTVELLKLSINLPDIWGDFLSSTSDNPGMEPVLEEFIFGLRYEEIRHLREIISSLESPVIDRKKAVEILIKEKIYEEKQEIFLTGDARGINSFFHTRLENAAKRELAEIEGPRQTIEELFLIYLLEKKRNVFPSGLKDSFSRFFGAFSRTV